MKYTILREKFLNMLQKAGFFTSYRLGDIEALKGVYVQARINKISLKTTNITDTFYGEVGGKVEMEGDVLVDYKSLIEVLKNVRDEKIVVEKTKNMLNIITESGIVKLPILDESTFPQEQERSWEDQDKNLFSPKDIDFVAFAAAVDETRPVLTGIYFDIREDGMYIVATDGFRLSLITRKEKEISRLKGKKFIIPAKSIQTAIKTLGKEIQKIQTDKEFSRVKIITEDSHIIIRFLEGEFPPYEKAVPQQTTTSTLFKTEDFLSALKTVSLFSRDGSNMVELTITETEIELYSVRSTNGEARLKIPLINKEGKDAKIVFNHKFLSAFFSMNQSKEVIFEMNDSNKPGIFKEGRKEGPIHIIMPIRSQE